MTRPRSGRGQRHRVRAVTRGRLLATAEDLFLSDGYSATSVEAIASEAGYTTGAVYSNFGGKADLFLAVLEQVTTVDLEMVRQALDEATTDEQRLAVFTASIARDPARWRARVVATIEFLSYLRQHPELHERMREAQRVAEATASELVVAVSAALGIEPPEPIDEIVRDIGALVNGLAIRSLYDEIDIPRAVSRALNSLLTGDRSDFRDLHLPARSSRRRGAAYVR
jgi:AcrR family transcriptional regulator